MNTTKKFKLIFSLSFIITFLFNTQTFAIDNITKEEYISSTSTTNSILVMNASNRTDFHKELFEGLRLSLEDNLPDHALIKSSTLGLSDNEILSNVTALINDPNNNIDMIICLDDKSAEFFTRYGTESFENIPVLFAYAGDSPISISPNMGGIFAPYNIDNFLSEILTFHQNITQMNFLINKELIDTYFFKKINEYIDTKSTDPNNKINYEIIISTHLNDIITPLKKENTLTIIYSPVRVKMGEHAPAKYLTPYGSLDYISEETGNPFYGGFKTFGTRFNAGSYMYDGFSLGMQIGEKAKKIIDGSMSIDKLGVTNAIKGPIFFINDELRSFYKLPKDLDKAIYYNSGTAITVFAQKRIKILYAITIFTFLLLFFFVIRNHFRKKSLIEQAKMDSIKTNFIANVSHELRTPLNIIISTIQLFDVYSKNGDIIYNSHRAKEKMQYLRGNSFRLLRLVNNIIDITKIDSGYFTIEKSPLNIVNVIEDVTLSSVAYAEKKEINLIFDTFEEEIIMPLDRDRIERIILNLLSNALKFTPAKGTITVTVLKSNDNVNIIVADTGIGIPEDKFDTIFKRFRQVDGTAFNKSEGSGIGLALCKSMVEMHNGTITVESKLNVGTSFIISLPISSEKILDMNTLENVTNKNTDDLLQVEYSDFSNYI